MAAFQVKMGSVTGSEHTFKMTNCQDKFRCAQYDSYIVGVVCDGCSEGQHSEVGAGLLAEFLVRQAGRYLQSGLQPEAVPELLYPKALEFLKSLSGWLLGSAYTSQEEGALVRDYFLATALGFITGGEQTVIFAAGDGLILLNDLVLPINQENKPSYLAYSILDRQLLSEEFEPASGFEAWALPTIELERLAIWSDGFDPALAGEIWQSGPNPRSLQRKLNVWATQKRFHDDTTGILVERSLPTN